MVMPEQSHLLFELALRINHPREPPSLELAPVEPRKVEGIREVEGVAQHIIHAAVINLLIVDEGIDGAFTAQSRRLVDLFRTSTKADPSEKMSSLVVAKTRH